VSFEYPPLSVGGAGVYASHITRELANFGHEVHVISPGVGKKETHSIENNVFVHRIPIIHKYLLSSPLFWFKLVNRYNAICKDAGGFDIFHNNGAIFSLPKWQVKGNSVVTVHHLARLAARYAPLSQRLLISSAETGALIPLIEVVVVSRADKIIAVSNFTKKTLISTYNVPPSKIEVILHGINVDEYHFPKDDILSYRKSIGLNDHVAFLFVGRLDDPRKNLPLLLRAFKIIDKNFRKSVKLVLVGAGDHLKVKRIAYSLGIKENLILLGYVDDLTLRKCYSTCDVFVSPSLLEGFGLTILEAMAAGKPIITCRVGVVPEIVRNNIIIGKVIEGRNPVELAEAMTFFADNPELIKKIGESNKKYVIRRFSWERAARETEAVYRKLI